MPVCIYMLFFHVYDEKVRELSFFQDFENYIFTSLPKTSTTRWYKNDEIYPEMRGAEITDKKLM